MPKHLDPPSVDARIGIATVLVTNLIEGWSNHPQEDETRAGKLLLEALQRDANRTVAHIVMGQLRRLQNRLIESQIEFETVIALDRNNAAALRQLGATLMYLGQPKAALPQIEKSIRLNPHDPNIHVALCCLSNSGYVPPLVSWSGSCNKPSQESRCNIASSCGDQTRTLSGAISRPAPFAPRLTNATPPFKFRSAATLLALCRVAKIFLGLYELGGP
jgi:tetratricopeptide (TPR) repeat protein